MEIEKKALPLSPGETEDTSSPVVQEIKEQDVASAVAVVGHPLHAMTVHFPIALVFATLGIDVLYWYSADAFWLRAGLWASGAAFWIGVIAAIIGTVELLAVPGIRVRIASWSHAVAAMTLLAICAANWRLRVVDIDAVLPHGLLLSLLALVFTGFAGWHGGKLVFDHGVGIRMSPDQ